jgi:hypothetical protein
MTDITEDTPTFMPSKGQILEAFGEALGITQPQPPPPQYPDPDFTLELCDDCSHSFRCYGLVCRMKLCNRCYKRRTCVLCSNFIRFYGNNPAPLRKRGRCCDTCNSEKVIPERLRLALGGNPN